MERQVEIQEMAIGQTADGVTGWLVAGGLEAKHSGRDIERTIKWTGDLGGGALTFEADFSGQNVNDLPAPLLKEDDSVYSFTQAGSIKVLLSPQTRVRGVLAGSTTPNFTMLGY